MSDETGVPSAAGSDWRAFTPEDSPTGLPDVMADPVHQDLSTAKLVPDDSAYDIELPVYDFSDGTERATGKTFELQELAQERPVALIFGSYT